MIWLNEIHGICVSDLFNQTQFPIVHVIHEYMGVILVYIVYQFIYVARKSMEKKTMIF